MARPKNPAHADALLTAATRLFATQGLSVSTAVIAKEAGVSSGTLFVYFETKSALINAVYVSLKCEMGSVAAVGLSEDASLCQQLRTMWTRWIGWAVADPDKRRALAQVSVAEDLTDESRQVGHEAYAAIAHLLGSIIANGPMQAAPLGFVSTLMSAIADATIDDLIDDADPTGSRSDLAFEAMWRALAG